MNPSPRDLVAGQAAEVAAHYEDLLAGHYTWMLGPSFNDLVEEQAQLLASLVDGVDRAAALDLGCGSGVHSVALARLGYGRVVGVDLSPTLLAELAERTRHITVVEGVEADFTRGVTELVAGDPVTTVVCMGDTLLHLPGHREVADLAGEVHRVLAPGGTFVMTFRDLSDPPTGLARFLPVRSDDSAILTCFLEDAGTHVRVHDLLYTRDGAGWRLGKSSYSKLKLSATEVVDVLESAGFHVAAPQLTPRGFIAIAATRPPA